MTTELWVLLGSSVLMLVLPLVYGAGYIRALGPTKMLGNRDDMPPVEGWFTRGKRAHANLTENMVPFAAVVLVAHAAGVHNGVTQGAALVFLAARIVHATSYMLGVGRPRAAAYATGMLATVVLALMVAIGAR